MVQTQSEAKRYFVEKVVQQARSEGVILSDAERGMLSWSESDPEFKADPELADQLATEMSDQEYESKVIGLLARRFATEVGEDPGSIETWRQPYAVLGQGDHYILIMINKAVDLKRKQWWKFWKSVSGSRRSGSE
jgi:hypothetical protein